MVVELIAAAGGADRKDCCPSGTALGAQAAGGHGECSVAHGCGGWACGLVGGRGDRSSRRPGSSVRQPLQPLAHAGVTCQSLLVAMIAVVPNTCVL